MSIFQIAGITLQVHADLPITNQTFASKFDIFQVEKPGTEHIFLHHHFSLPEQVNFKLGRQVYRRVPWAIYQHAERWNYLGIARDADDLSLWRMAEFNLDHTSGHIYSPDAADFARGNLQSLTTFPTDQIILAAVLADRAGCYLHASGIIINHQGLLFVGHSGAGKSTMASLLQDEGEILCDDRVILRRWSDGFQVHGTWSHGDIPIVSSAAAPLRAILLLEQAPFNQLSLIADRAEVARRLPFFVIKPLVTADWWEKTLDLVGHIAGEVPVYQLQFDKSVQVKDLILELVS